MRHCLVSRLGIQQFSCTNGVKKCCFLLVLSVPPLNVMEQPLVPVGREAMDLCLCVAASHSAMSSPLFLLSKVNNPMGSFCAFFSGNARFQL